MLHGMGMKDPQYDHLGFEALMRLCGSPTMSPTKADAECWQTEPVHLHKVAGKPARRRLAHPAQHLTDPDNATHHPVAPW